MILTQLKLRLFAAASGLALLWAAPSALANVYATNIKLNGSVTTNITSGAGVPLAVTFRLNQAATYGTTLNILSGATVVRSISIASGNQGTLQGLNTVTWDGNDAGGTPMAVGTYSVSITAAAAGYSTWTQISTSASTAAGLYGVTVNNNPNSAWYGRVFAGNKSGGTGAAPCGIMKMNADLSGADEGTFGTASFSFANNGYNPWGVKYNSADDRLYFLDFNTQGDLYACDSLLTTNQHVLTANNYATCPYSVVRTGSGWRTFDVVGSGSSGYFFLGDADYPGAGAFFWKMVNGVANPSDTSGTQLIAQGSTLLISQGGIFMDAATNFYLGQQRANAGDANPRAVTFTNWDGATKITTPNWWTEGAGDNNCLNNYELTLDSRTNPHYVAIAIGAATGYSGGIRVLNSADGTVVTANGGAQVLTNLDSGDHYWGVAFDAVGNLYGCESITAHVRAFTPPGVSTNTTVAFAHVNIANVGPTITAQPQPSTITTNQGASLIYMVTAAGTPTLGYQWTKNSASLTGQTGTSLALNNVQVSDGGTYAVVITNAWGSVTSSPAVLIVAAKPVITQQPQSMTTYIGGVAAFAMAATGSQPLSYQWFLGSNPVAGATNPSYNLSNVQLANAGTYSCLITNTYGSTNSATAVLTVINQTNTDYYATTILNDGPMAYYRLNETNGTVAHDVWGGHNGQYNSVALAQPGFSCIDPDFGAGFGPGPNSYVGSITGITFEATSDTTAFSVEAWVNGQPGQANGAGIITKGTGSGGEQFNLDVYNGVYRFFVRDHAGAIPNGTITASVGPDGTWQHVVGVYDGPNGFYYLYVNGQQAASQQASAAGILSSSHEISIGSRQSGSGAYDSNFKGTLDEAGIYNYALNSTQIYNHYTAQLIWPGFPPMICQEPQPATVWPEPSATATFSVTVGGDNSFTYQWLFNGTPIPGANSSSYTINGALPTDGGMFSCAVTNSYGGLISASALLTVLTTNSYTAAVLGDSPISYWRLDEASGSIAHDYFGGNHGTYNNVTLGQPGYSVADPDTCIALPANPASRAWVQVTNYPPFSFAGYAQFTFEGWVNFSNVTGVQRLFSTMRTNVNPYGYGFGISGANQLVFTTAGVLDTYQPLSTSLVPNQWYCLVCACDGGNYNFYVNGQLAGSQPVTANTGAGVPLTLGANSTWPYAEQVSGNLDEMAVYNSALTPDQVLAHYNARPLPLKPVAQRPVIITGATNYVSLSATIQDIASGQSLSYQWYKAPSTLLPGATGSTLTLSHLAPSDAGSYYVYVSNAGGFTNTPVAVLTVWSIPTNATQLNLTNDLVLHLPFDSDYNDISGLSHNGTNVGATVFVPGAIGGGALSYSTDAGVPSYNYVTLGVVPDLQFGTTTDFSVSYWVQLPAGAAYGDLPFFTVAVGSLGNGGFTFAPGVDAGGSPTGGWGWTIGSVTVPGTYNTPNYNTINDGNWHHLVHVAQRSANCTTYLDGVEVGSTAIIEAGNATSFWPATIGQDPSGTYAVTAGAYIDDLAVWTNTLAPLQISGMYLAGVSNSPGVSFAPAISAPPTPVTLQVVQVGAQWQITWSAGTGTLWSAPAVTGPWNAIETNATSPYIIPMTAPRTFYRLRQ